jgi:uncharacterized protein (DUF433 family)
MSTTLAIDAIQPPLAANEHGVILVGGTRVALDTVVSAFKAGATAEEIVQRYPTLALDDVYVTIAFYLRNTSAIEDYLRQRSEVRQSLQRENEARFDPSGVRDRLMARQVRCDIFRCGD